MSADLHRAIKAHDLDALSRDRPVSPHGLRDELAGYLRSEPEDVAGLSHAVNAATQAREELWVVAFDERCMLVGSERLAVREG